MLVARRGVSPAWSHDNVSLLVDLTSRVKFHLDTTEHGGCFQANILSTGSLMDNSSSYNLIIIVQEGEFYSNSNPFWQKIWCFLLLSIATIESCYQHTTA